ncbi:MAG TPA: Asp-tRNA(Asn)/Glu-tRNA(Gln) amidotransferase subunit GatC [Gemmatimonadales bacterium]|nr:Asp-tRNA(Asn)/Glu-tRNA(Gln) amidotransferase subunit GatC [Gemmatimonadales bacterium]
MSIGSKDVLHVAALAELDVPASELQALVEQLGRIVDYVAQLNAVPAGEQAAPFLAGPHAAPLREDEIRPAPLARGPDAIAPEFRDGLFLVPRLGAMEDE